MTKQEEIREILCDLCGWGCDRKGGCNPLSKAIKALKSKGVVIKVDRELPELDDNYLSEDNTYLYYQGQQDMFEAKFLAVEELT